METNGENTLEQICSMFGVRNIYELDQLYLKHDQDLIKNSKFDLFDKNLVNNQIKDALLKVELAGLSKDKLQVIQGILWLWYHHATTIAIWKKHDIPRARELCKIALKYLYPTHPNKITSMICMLLDGDIDNARKWNETEVGEVEKEYALHLLDEYKKGVFNNQSPSHKNDGD